MTFLQQEKWYSTFSWGLEKMWQDNGYDGKEGQRSSCYCALINIALLLCDKYNSFGKLSSLGHMSVSISLLKIFKFMSSKTWLLVIITLAAQLIYYTLSTSNLWTTSTLMLCHASCKSRQRLSSSGSQFNFQLFGLWRGRVHHQCPLRLPRWQLVPAIVRRMFVQQKPTGTC